MKIFFIIILAVYSTVVFAANEIWLQDTDCKVLVGDGYSVKVADGSLITYICKKENIEITCSNTSNTSSMSNNKPSAITTYNELVIDKDSVFWEGASFEGMVLLNLRDKRYLATGTYITKGGLLNKYCVGEIKNY